MSAITITIPAIPAEEISKLNQTEDLLAQTSLELVAKLRQKYSALAAYNGFVRTSYYSIGNQNWSEKGGGYLHRDGRQVKGLLAADYFDDSKNSEFSGVYGGERLYLTADGWVEIKRVGRWSQWQGAPDCWTCDGSFGDGQEYGQQFGGDEAGIGGTIRWLSDEDVVAEYTTITDIVEELAKSLATMATKIPERHARKRALAESLQSLVSQL